MRNVTMVKNKAGIYGSNNASIPKRLIRIEKSELKVDSFPNYAKRDRRILTEASNSSIDNVQSGGEISLYFALIDKYGSVIRTDGTSKLFIR